MSPRLRVVLVVAGAAAVTAGTAVGVTLATRTHVSKSNETPPRFFADPTAPVAVSRDVLRVGHRVTVHIGVGTT